MPPPASVNELLELVHKSGVTDGEKFQVYVRKLSASGAGPADPNTMAVRLVQDGILTQFQAEQLLQGKWKRFTIGKYKVLEKLGAGGMGQVFLCEHKLMRRRVAVKVLPTAKAEDQASLDRFYREAKAAAAVDHPNIVRAYDIDQDDNLHFLVMEYVDGVNLHELVKKFGPLDITRSCHYIYAAAIGLQHAHEMGLVHRDIKPGNILLDRTGVIKILDMGLARFFHDEDDILTKKYDENVLGTADYLSPEQALDSHAVDIRTDVYSLGATMYYLLTGRAPFPEGSVAQKLIWHQNRTPTPIKSLRPEVPDNLLAIIEKMMAKDLDERYQTPAEVVEAFAPWVTTPIPPPPEREMPSLSPAASGAVVGTGMRGPATSATAVVTRPHGATQPRPHWSGASQSVIVTPPPAYSRPAPPPAVPTGGTGVWESLDSETQSVAQADTDRAGKRPPATPTVPATADGWTEPETKSRLPLLIVAAVLLVVAGVTAFFLLGKKKPVVDGTGSGGSHKKLVVSKAAGENVYTSLRAAIGKASPGDIIAIREERLQEPTIRLESRNKDVTIESDLPGGKPAVIEFTSPVSGTVAGFAVNTVAGLHVRNIEFDSKGAADFGVSITGVCPGLVFENVTVRGARTQGFRLDNVSGETGEGIVLDRVRVILAPGAEAGVFVSAPGNLQSKRLSIKNSRIEGPTNGRGKAGIVLEGGMSDVEVTGNRFFRLASGILFSEVTAGRTSRPQIVANTFYDTTVGVQFDLAASDKAGSFSSIVTRNYFAKTTTIAQRNEGDGPVAGVTFIDNASDKNSKGGNVPAEATKFDSPELPPPNPDDNANFLRFPTAAPEVGANKARVGAN